MKLKFLIPFIVLALLITSCANTPLDSAAPTNPSINYPLTLVDASGTEVTIPAEPQRIISLVPSTTEILCALGSDICSKIIGVDPNSDYPSEIRSVEKVGDTLFGKNPEAVKSLEPDLVFSSKGAEAYSEQLRDLDLNVYTAWAETYSEVFAKINDVGRVVNRQDEARTLVNDLQLQVSSVTDRLTDVEAPTVLYYVSGGLYVASSTSFIGTLLDRVKAKNIVNTEQTFPQFSSEKVVEADPQIIIVADAYAGTDAFPGNPGSTIDDLVSTYPAWSDISAVKNRQVYTLTVEQVSALSRTGPRLAEGIKILADIFYPELAPF